MEPLTRRVAIHFHTDSLQECVDFYSLLLPFIIVKDIELVGGERWVTLAKSDNLGIQLHFHPTREDREPEHPMRLEFSHPDPASVRDHLRDNGINVEEWEYPWTWGMECTDPIGNRISISFWGDDDDDLGNGYGRHVATGNAG